MAIGAMVPYTPSFQWDAHNYLASGSIKYNIKECKRLGLVDINCFDVGFDTYNCIHPPPFECDCECTTCTNVNVIK